MGNLVFVSLSSNDGTHTGLSTIGNLMAHAPQTALNVPYLYPYRKPNQSTPQLELSPPDENDSSDLLCGRGNAMNVVASLV